MNLTLCSPAHPSNKTTPAMSEEQARKEAEKFIKEAEAHLSSKSSFFGLFSSGPDYYEAIDAYNRAGNVYKSAKLCKKASYWREAGDVYLKAGETEIKSGEADGSARKFLNASTCYKKIDPELAIKCLMRANEIFVKNGRFHIAATHEKEIAEIYEQTLNDPQQAIKFYLSAADRYSIDDSTATAQGCTIKAATISGDIGNYEEAAKMFEGIAEEMANNQLTKYSVKDYLLRAGLCRLCLDDLIGAKKYFEKYTTIEFSFASTKEYAFLQEIAVSIENGDIESFSDSVTKWDKTNAVDEWKTKILLKIKNLIDEEPSLT